MEFSIAPPERAAPNGPPRGFDRGWTGGWVPPRSGGRNDLIAPKWYSFRAFLRACWRRHQSRTALLRMNAHLLNDVGLTYAEAEREANKPFWRA
ncbi:MAG: DUF1127 domain-containing protein [Rhodospirillales bacterium]|nr:DUF1127 domain-containing protein [Rhodospirillales bacterium]